MIFKNIPRKKNNGGFTLIELLVTFAIYIVISGLVVANYRGYGATTVSENAAESIVIAIRQAQVYGSAGKGSSGLCGVFTSLFDCRYGVSFVSPANGITIFVDKNDNKVYDAGDVMVETIAWKDKSVITGVSCFAGGFSVCSTANILNLTFRRPSPDAIINSTNDMTGLSSGGYDSATITISNGLTGIALKTHTITITRAGQIAII